MLEIPPSPKNIITYGHAQYVGTRVNQEDYVLFNMLSSSSIVGIVADGMGGHEQGEVASQEAAQCFFNSYSQSGDLYSAAQACNNHIRQLKDSGKLASDAGSTLIALSIHDTKLSWCSVGDSYLYLIRRGQLKRINCLHTWGDILDAKAQAGTISSKEARGFTNRHALYSAITGINFKEDGLEIKSLLEAIHVGDRYILCSDGIDSMGIEKLSCLFTCESFQMLDAQSAASKIIEEVQQQQACNQDNTTALVIDYGKASASSPAQVSYNAQYNASKPAPSVNDHGSKKKDRLFPAICLGMPLLVVLFAALYININSINIPQKTSDKPVTQFSRDSLKTNKHDAYSLPCTDTSKKERLIKESADMTSTSIHSDKNKACCNITLSKDENLKHRLILDMHIFVYSLIDGILKGEPKVIELSLKNARFTICAIAKQAGDIIKSINKNLGKLLTKDNTKETPDNSKKTNMQLNAKPRIACPQLQG